MDVPAFDQRFELRRVLGSGAFGEVFEAFDRERSAVVALKRLRKVDAAALYHFKREFRSLTDLAHDNLVRLYELVSDGESWAFTMELIAGSPFHDYVRAGPHVRTFGDSSASDSSSDAHARREDDLSTRITRASVAVPALPAGVPAAPELGSTAFDEGRLRRSLTQLVRGVASVHAAGKLHCDLKPPNVLVEAGGRVVVLDFGVVAEIAAHDDALDEVGGTPAYMAPEYEGGQPPTPQSDWYSVGVMLYEVLTGMRPFSARGKGLTLLKRDVDAPAPGTRVAGLPRDLSELCVALLSRDPAARPTGDQILQQLGAATVQDVAAPIDTLLGRDAELAALRAAFDAGPRIVHLHAPSGLGKTALALHFVSTLPADTRILRGRCYESESVPYKAIDGIVDDLSRQLRRLPEYEARALAPPSAWALGRLFPVLQRVPGFTQSNAEGVVDALEVRRRGFAALRALLMALCAQGPLVLWIDDLQWGDADSLALLSSLFTPPNVPPMLLLLTARSEPGPHETWLQKLGESVVTTLELPALSAASAASLARRVLPEADVARAVRDAGGNPFLLTELARYSLTRSADRRLTVDDMIRARAAELPDAARHLLGLVCLSGRIRLDPARSASGLEGQMHDALDTLARVHLVKTAGLRRHDVLEPYHDRVRESVIASLSPAVRRDLHRALATALSAVRSPDAEELALHWAGAGDQEKAATYTLLAAEQAEAQLAFEHAAGLYTAALALGVSPARRAEIETRLGDALAKSGRGADAARAYLAAAARKDDHLERVELKRRAADQLVISGHIDQGIALAQEVLATFGMSFPATRRRALLALAWGRARVALRGLGFEERSERELAPEELVELEVCFQLSKGLSMIDTLGGAAFQTVTMLRTLRAGEPYRVARALATEAGYLSTEGTRTWPQTSRVIDKMNALAARVDRAESTGWAELTTAMALFLCGRFGESLAVCERCERTLRDRCTGMTWELDTLMYFKAQCHLMRGELRTLSQVLPALLEDAVRRGDRYAEAYLRSDNMFMVQLCADRPAAALDEVKRGVANWSHEAFYLQHHWMLTRQSEILLYRGEYDEALRLVNERWPALDRSYLLMVQMVDIEAHNVRARAALGAASVAPTAKAREALLKLAEKQARRMAKQKVWWGQGNATFTHASVAAARGHTDRALELLETAERIFTEGELALQAQVARRRRGELSGNAALVDEMNAWCVRESVQSPECMARMLAPGTWWVRPS